MGRRLYNGVRLVDRPSPHNVARIDNGCVGMVVRMMHNGFTVDRDALSDLSRHFGNECERIDGEIEACIGRRINTSGSSPDVRTLLFRELKLQIGTGRKLKITKTGLESTGKLEIEPYLGAHPVVRLILQRRQYDKLKGTYADALLEWARYDKRSDTWRIHTTYKTTSVNGGRLASEDPDLQNIPTRTEDGRKIKNCFIASPGKRIIDCDFSQIHMRVAAHLSHSKFMSDVFHSNGDIHTNNAMRVYGIVRPEDVPDDLRYPMKRTGFGILYLITAIGLARQLNSADAQDVNNPKVWTENDCQVLIDGYYDVNPEIRSLQEKSFQRARRWKKVWDMFGRIRLTPEVDSAHRWIQEAGLRQAANLPMIGGEVGLMKLAMAELSDIFDGDADLWRRRAGVEELVQVHDSLVAEANADYAADVGRVMQTVMENVCELDVPIKADCKTGTRWGSVEKLRRA